MNIPTQDPALDPGTEALDADAPAAAPAAGIGRTQADGLRALFGGPDGPVVYCIASALAPDATVTLGLGAAHALRRGGHLTLLVDEVPLVDRQSAKGFPYPVRYDLGQVFTGSVPLSRAVRKVAESLWFAAGVKVRQAVARKQVRAPSLTHMLRQSEVDFDFVVVATCEPFGAAMSCYGDDIQRIVVAAPEDASLSRALSHIRELSVMLGGAEVPVLMVGGADAQAGRDAFDRLAAAAGMHLEQPLEWLGWVRVASVAAFGVDSDEGTTLPVSLYQMLAGRIAAPAGH